MSAPTDDPQLLGYAAKEPTKHGDINWSLLTICLSGIALHRLLEKILSIGSTYRKQHSTRFKQGSRGIPEPSQHKAGKPWVMISFQWNSRNGTGSYPIRSEPKKKGQLRVSIADMSWYGLTSHFPSIQRETSRGFPWVAEDIGVQWKVCRFF